MTYYTRRRNKTNMTPEKKLLMQHTAVLGGHPHDRWGQPFAVERNMGDGHAKCMCGELSPELNSANERRAWMTRHRKEVVAEAFGTHEQKELQSA